MVEQKKSTTPKYTATSDKIKVDNRMAVVYTGLRGGKYIKKNGAFVSIKSIKGGALGDYSSENISHKLSERGIHHAIYLKTNYHLDNYEFYHNSLDPLNTITLLKRDAKCDVSLLFDIIFQSNSKYIVVKDCKIGKTEKIGEIEFIVIIITQQNANIELFYTGKG